MDSTLNIFLHDTSGNAALPHSVALDSFMTSRSATPCRCGCRSYFITESCENFRFPITVSFDWHLI